MQKRDFKTKRKFAPPNMQLHKIRSPKYRVIQDRFSPGCCKVSEKSGGPRGRVPWRGFKGAEPVCVGKYGIS